MISAMDRGLTLGDGLFDTVLAEAGAFLFWDEHCSRLERGCDALGLPRPDRAALRAGAHEALASEGLQSARAAVRMSWTAGAGGRGLDRPATPEPQLIVIAAPAPLPQTPARLVTASVRRNETSLASRLKTLSYLDNVLARREAAAAGADEALMLNTRGEVACAAAANIFWIEDGELLTPALACGVLDGIMRAHIMDCAGMRVTECAASPDRVKEADAIFLTNSLIGLRRVASIDGRPMGGEGLIERIRARL